jgi:hypothetical protein
MHTRVAYGLVSVLFEDGALVAEDLREFEEKAFAFTQEPGISKLRETIRPAIEDALRKHSGIFDGPKWVAAFQRIITAAVQQKQSGEPLKDIYSEERIRPAPADHGRESVFVLSDSLQVEGAQTVSVANSDANRSVSESSGHDCHDGPPSNYLSAVAIPKDVTSRDRAREYRLDWLFDASDKDPVAARIKAVDYIRENNPELADKLVYVKDDAGRDVPFLQLPCRAPRKSSETGNIRGYFELPFLFVVKA